MAALRTADQEPKTDAIGSIYTWELLERRPRGRVGGGGIIGLLNTLTLTVADGALGPPNSVEEMSCRGTDRREERISHNRGAL